MIIEKMFQKDINRKINGVVKVVQDENDIVFQELNEYVITRELKKHFTTFFNNYEESFSEKTDDIGVWISGFFGSGKSHFLKILSYLLENKEVSGVKTVELFREKFADDPATFMTIDKATRGKTDTILFNIDVEGPLKKDKTAVLRVFAKMFYKYLGFHGADLKIAKLEQFVDKKGKTDQFQQVFKEKSGSEWVEARVSYAFFEDDIVATLQQVLGMSKDAAQNWFNGTETADFSIAQLVSEIKQYVKSQPKDFRLLFMIDEVGQYIGADTSLLMNLQSLVETIGSECEGKVWVICTGQEAIDEIIRTRENEFSRIQARFKTRLSLSSASADEVIRKRILLKTPEAEKYLEQVYAEDESILRNLFSFNNSILDIKGYSNAGDFSSNFPFVPYQFILMQKVFSEIRKHGNSGKHLSGGERSMLSGFQEAAQRIENKNEYALAPFYLFYDTIHTFLDSSIRRVIERCERAAVNGDGIEAQDVDVLKLLYLIRYVDDVKANLDNIVILMADDIHLDKIIMRDQVRSSLDRLLSQNYIGCTGDIYNFLTDEEQNIHREIYRNTFVEPSSIVQRIGSIIFSNIYPTKKYRYGKYDFAFDQWVDRMAIGTTSGEIQLRILTVATDETEKNELRLLGDSYKQAIVVLSDTPYYELIENAMKIRKYVKQRNVSQLPASVQTIIRAHQEDANRYEVNATEELKKAIESAEFYVDGEHLDIRSGDAKSKLDEALGYLVTHVYSELNLITKNAETDADIVSILNGTTGLLSGMEDNRGAATKVEEYLEIQFSRNLPTTMADVQSRYQAIPYGWKEIDIASVVAQLIYNQKVTIKYGGVAIKPDDKRLPDMLRKKSEIGKTSISKRQAVSIQKIRKAKEFLVDYFNEMDIPDNEDGLVSYIDDRFSKEQRHYEELYNRYESHNYPDKALVFSSINMIRDLLSQKKDNTALIECVTNKEYDFYDLKEKMQNVESFFKNQVTIFDSAVKCEDDLSEDQEYISKDDEAFNALKKIRAIIEIPANQCFNYARIPELNTLLATVRTKHDAMLEKKRAEVLDIVNQCMTEIQVVANNEEKVRDIVNASDEYFSQKKTKISDTKMLALLDGLVLQMCQYKDSICKRIDDLRKPPVVVSNDSNVSEPPQSYNPQKVIKAVHRQAIFPAGTLMSDSDIDAYVEAMRIQMKQLLSVCDGIRLN